MLVYTATKQSFLSDVRDNAIHEKIRLEGKTTLSPNRPRRSDKNGKNCMPRSRRTGRSPCSSAGVGKTPVFAEPLRGKGLRAICCVTKARTGGQPALAFAPCISSRTPLPPGPIGAQSSLHRRTGAGASESHIAAWRNSMQFMASILQDEGLPQDAGVSIEYQLPLSSKRIDFILTGQDEARQETAVIIELKQWSQVAVTDMDAVVRTRLGGGEVNTQHPSYQAWSYAAMIEDYNETVRQEKIVLKPCAYLHNLDARGAINDARYLEHTNKAPVFISSDARRLAEFLKQHVRHGDLRDIMYRIEHGRLRPSKSLADSLAAMMQGNREFLMIDEQKLVYETALQLAHRAQPRADKKPAQKQVLIVEGGPGTGKSVVAINLLVELTKREMVVQYVSKNAAPRAVYASMLAGTMRQTRINNLFRGSGAFIEAESDTFDALLVDEAHRLNEMSGLYGNLGENQIKELIEASRLTVFFLDEDQRVTLKDIGSKAEIKRWAREIGKASKGAIAVHELTLSSQFRCNGSDAYLAWLDDVLQKRETANTRLEPGEFEFKVFDDPKALRTAIEDKNRERNKARLVAGYCWNWASRKDRNAMDVVVKEHGFEAQWNLSSDGSLWAIAPESVSEVGCIHTSQGLELDYVGVIVGPDLVVRDGQVVCDAGKRSTQDQSIRGWKQQMKLRPEETQAQMDAIIKNTYRTLMTRAQKGCYVFCTDPETNEYFRARLGSLMREEPEAPKQLQSAPLADVLPFRIVPAREVKPYVNAVPLFDVKIAAGAFSEEQSVESREWVKLPDHFRMQPGLFVAQAIGESMNRVIPNGAWCLFRANPGGTRQGKIVLVELRGASDPETGGRYTVKRYSSEKVANIDHEWTHASISLLPDSTDTMYQPLVLQQGINLEVFVVGEYLGALFT